LEGIVEMTRKKRKATPDEPGVALQKTRF